MSRTVARVVVFVGVFALVNQSSAQDEKPTKVEVGKRGKAATAFVEVPTIGSGTAFCIHPTGLFITNEHVVHGGEKGEIILVLDPSLETQRILKAKIVRTDKEHDLALLRVDGAKDLPSLPLGSMEGIAELSEVIACGFPLGRGLSLDKKEYPAISVNAGSVTALRYKAKSRELDHIQIDVALTYGNSGGPVLDTKGQVVGVVVSGIPAKGINQAIPVSILDRFLKTPDIAFTPPELTREALEKPLEFKVGVVSFVPKTPDPSLKLILQAEDEEPREFQMKKEGGAWVVSAKPIGKIAARRMEISVRIGKGAVTGTIEDAVFKVGDKPIRLSAVRRIDFNTKPVVLLADGRTTIEGEITNLGTVEIDLADQKIKVDLMKATQITVQAAPEIMSVMATVVVVVEGKEIARAESRMIVRDAVKIGAADPSKVKITPPMLDEEKVIKRLPDVSSNVAIGGGGRYLIFQLPKLKRLAVFDVNEGRVTKYIPLTEDDIAYAAGLDSVVIGLKKAGKLERWSLTTFELEKTASPPFKEDISSVVMGHGSNGPAVVNGQFLDLDTFRGLPIVDKNGKYPVSIGGAIFPSADGTVFGAWNTHYSPSTSTTFVLEGGVVNDYGGGDLLHVIPGPDGKTVFTGRGIVSRTLQRFEADDASYGYCLPAVRGDYFLSLTPANGGGKGGGFTIYLRGLKQPIAKLDKADHGLSFDGWDREKEGVWRRVFFIPDAKVIAVLPSGNDRVVLYKFDPEAALEKSGQDYLLVTSQPPREVKAGGTFSYPIRVKSKQGGLAYKLDLGPKGMEVSSTGVVTWTVPAGTPAGNEDVILTVRDKSGQEVFHNFTVKVVK